MSHLVSLLLVAMLPSSAQSFECSRASTPAESGICSSEELKKLDDELNAAFSAAIKKASAAGKQALRKEQREWLQRRDVECLGQATCLAEIMKSRLATLKGGVEAAAAEAGRDAKGYALRRFGKEGTAFDVTYPQLTGLKDEVVRERVNDAIRKEARGWQCHGGAGGEHQTFTVETTVVRLDEQVFSYKLVFDYFCSGPYPDAHVEARTYDLVWGKLVQTEDLFKPGFDSAAIAKLILESGPVDPECKEAYEKASTFHFFLVDHSIVFFPSLPHVVQACANEHAFAISHLKEHLRPGTLLTRSESH